MPTRPMHVKWQAAIRIAVVVLANEPKLFNRIDTMSSLFFLNQHLRPGSATRSILLNRKGIRDR
ncbi:hypothetical protein NGF19_27770 [Streptomyces sp. RY43-2]|uniref:Uncharacterized protein n=1 Tax=Streptomyces macrolidinus TaxID=2952607 RepID=A0ABT0ZLT4_9ACTN|nr:hypothetical protein [Streptomyces macrolidinus]MCN9244536.1 hypothetical protein [Streptomyces macrolidinus]